MKVNPPVINTTSFLVAAVTLHKSSIPDTQHANWGSGQMHQITHTHADFHTFQIYDNR